MIGPYSYLIWFNWYGVWYAPRILKNSPGDYGGGGLVARSCPTLFLFFSSNLWDSSSDLS